MNRFKVFLLFIALFVAGMLCMSGHLLAAFVLLTLFMVALAMRPMPGYLHENTLTNLIPDLYASLDIVSRELVGFIPTVNRDSRAERVAVGQTLRSAVTRASEDPENTTPAMAIPSAVDQTIDNVPFTLTKSQNIGFSWNGEQILGLNNNGPGHVNILQDQFTQAMRKLVNAIELDVAVAGYKGASRAYGTAGTTPFDSNLAATAQLRKILDDNGAPASDRSLVLDTTAGANVRTLQQLTKANEAGTDMTLRSGELLNIHGFSLHESAQVVTTTAVGTATNATTDNAGYAIGATVLTLASAGTGTILIGDVITFQGDTNKYVVASGDTDVSNGGTITLAAPGLRKAMSTATKAITVIGVATMNLGYSRNAILLGTRLPALPPQGDLAIDRVTVTDPRSNLSFEVALYPGFRMVTYKVFIAWGVAIEKPEHLAALLG